MTTPFVPDPHVEPERLRIESGGVVKDPDGSKWRIVHAFSNGISRVRVGSLAEEVMFGKTEVIEKP